MSTTPTFLYFDLGNVLFYFDHVRACRQIAKVSQLPLGDVMSFFAADHHVALETGATTVEAVHELFCRSLGVTPSVEQVALAGSNIFQINASMIPLIARLTQANQRMGILSNTNVPHWAFLTDGRYRILPEFFETTILSYEAASMKPDRHIYEVAAKKVGVAPERIFFTDDRIENVEGALAVGWQAVLFTDADSLEEELRRRGVAFN